jgi:hypothetical protein
MVASGWGDSPWSASLDGARREPWSSLSAYLYLAVVRRTRHEEAR